MYHYACKPCNIHVHVCAYLFFLKERNCLKASVCQFSLFVLLTLQVDIELSFTTQEDVRNLIENMILQSWPSFKEQITLPFPSMTYHEAMVQYGSDKPDTRYNMKVLERLKILQLFIDLYRILCSYLYFPNLLISVQY